MPIYEYQCQSCEQVFEYMQRMSEDPKTECEACEGKLERIISQSAFHLKGGGWYKDLYSSTKKEDSSSEKKAMKASGDSSSSAASTSESKPAASKSESKASPSTSSKTTSND